MSATAIPDSLIILTKIFPTFVQFLLSIIPIETRLMRSVLRRNPGKCLHLRNATAAQLERRMKLVPTIPMFSHELSRFQSTVGLGLTIFNSFMLSNNAFLRVFCPFFLVGLVMGYYGLSESVYQGKTESSGFAYSLSCAALGVVFVLVSTVYT